MMNQKLVWVLKTPTLSIILIEYLVKVVFHRFTKISLNHILHLLFLLTSSIKSWTNETLLLWNCDCLSKEILDWLEDFTNRGFKFRSIVADNHSYNVAVFDLFITREMRSSTSYHTVRNAKPVNFPTQCAS